jgi:hypothetical protein
MSLGLVIYYTITSDALCALKQFPFTSDALGNLYLLMGEEGLCEMQNVGNGRGGGGGVVARCPGLGR